MTIRKYARGEIIAADVATDPENEEEAQAETDEDEGEAQDPYVDEVW